MTVRYQIGLLQRVEFQDKAVSRPTVTVGPLPVEPIGRLSLFTVLVSCPPEPDLNPKRKDNVKYDVLAL